MTAVATKPKPAAKRTWGNPETSSFRKTYIRDINFEGVLAEVHREILDIAVEVMHLAQQQGVLPPASPIPLVSYDAKAKKGPTAFGACLGIYAEVKGAEEWGFQQDDKLGLVFGGDIEAAEALTIKAQELLAERGSHEDLIPEEEEAWAHTRPGKRDIKRGSKGDDVQFLQILLGTADQSGVYEQTLEAAVRWLQEQKGMAVTGEVDAAVWSLIYPRSSAYGLGRGDAGFTVRVVQSLLVAYGWDPELAISGRYGNATDHAIRQLQLQLGLRINGYMRAAEWVALLGPREEWPKR